MDGWRHRLFASGASVLRYRESDIGRNRRQRQFLWALRDQVSKTNLLAKFPELYSAFQSTFTTDMSVLEMLDLMNWGTTSTPQKVRAGGLGLNDAGRAGTTAEGVRFAHRRSRSRARRRRRIWSAPCAMVDANRQDATTASPCRPASLSTQPARRRTCRP
ncbi:MAG: hypothetical protein U0X20_25050 [Caldilineaceae bacterium]